MPTALLLLKPCHINPIQVKNSAGWVWVSLWGDKEHLLTRKKGGNLERGQSAWETQPLMGNKTEGKKWAKPQKTKEEGGKEQTIRTARRPRDRNVEKWQINGPMAAGSEEQWP